MNDTWLLISKCFWVLIIMGFYFKKKLAKQDRELVEKTLGFVPKNTFSIFESIYSEDYIVGVSWQYSDGEIDKLIKESKLFPLLELKDMDEKEDFFNLLNNDENSDVTYEELQSRSIEFINFVRFIAIQNECKGNNQIYFEYQSGVNWFTVLWIDGLKANYLMGDVYLTGYLNIEDESKLI